MVQTILAGMADFVYLNLAQMSGELLLSLDKQDLIICQNDGWGGKNKRVLAVVAIVSSSASDFLKPVLLIQ
jgi:hypothetical protein